jgi:hypothetical protein
LNFAIFLLLSFFGSGDAEEKHLLQLKKNSLFFFENSSSIFHTQEI